MALDRTALLGVLPAMHGQVSRRAAVGEARCPTASNPRADSTAYASDQRPIVGEINIESHLIFLA